VARFSWKVPILAALAAVALLSVVACGSDDNTATNAQAQTGASASPPAADPHAGWPKTFHVGIFGGDDAEATLNDNTPLKDFLNKELGIPVDLVTGTSYNAVIEAMHAGHVDAMSVGPFSYILAVQEAIAVGVSSTAPEGQAVYDPNIPPYYISVIITMKGNGISSLQDLKGKNFSFVDPASTSGHLAPATLLLKNGLDPDKDMHTVYAAAIPPPRWPSTTARRTLAPPTRATCSGSPLQARSSGASTPRPDQ
jgi:phosphonate transport system substrate-binding protein